MLSQTLNNLSDWLIPVRRGERVLDVEQINHLMNVLDDAADDAAMMERLIPIPPAQQQSITGSSKVVSLAAWRGATMNVTANTPQDDGAA